MIWRTIRRSRRVRYCSRGGCERRVIAIGDSYLSCVASPHHDDLGNTRWWRLVECESCAKRNGNWPNPTRPEGERSMSRYAEHTLTLNGIDEGVGGWDLHCHHDMATWGHYDPETGEYTEADGCWLMSWWEACWNDLLAVKGPIASLPIPVRPSDDWGPDGGTIVLDERPGPRYPFGGRFVTSETPDELVARARRLLEAAPADRRVERGRVERRLNISRFTDRLDPAKRSFDRDDETILLVASHLRWLLGLAESDALEIRDQRELLEALVGALEERTRERDEARSTAEHWHHRWCEDQGIYDPLLTPPLPWEDR